MKKGFTFPEMIGALVLLSVLVLIAVPVVLDLIKDTKTRTDEVSINNYINAVNTALMNYSIENKGKELASVPTYSEVNTSNIYWAQKNNTIVEYNSKMNLTEFNVLYDRGYDRFLHYYRTDESGKNLYYGLELVKDSEGKPLEIEYDGTPVSCKYLYIKDNQIDSTKSYCNLNKDYKEEIYEEYKIGDYIKLNIGWSFENFWYVIEDSSKHDSKVTLISASPLYFEKDETTGEYKNIKQDYSNPTEVKFDEQYARKDENATGNSVPGNCYERYKFQSLCPFYYLPTSEGVTFSGAASVKKIVDAYSEIIKEQFATKNIDVEVFGRLLSLQEALDLMFYEDDINIKYSSGSVNSYNSNKNILKNAFMHSDYKYWTLTESDTVSRALNFIISTESDIHYVKRYNSVHYAYVRPVITISKNAIN